MEKQEKCLPGIKGEKMHLPMIEKRRRSRCFAPPLWRPGCDSAAVPEPWF